MNQVCSSNNGNGGCGSDTSSGGGDDEASEPPNIDTPGPFSPILIVENIVNTAQKNNNDADSTTPFDFDCYLQSTLGEFGRYQQFIVWFLCIPACFLSAYGTLDMVFLAFTPDFRCNANQSYANTLQGFKNSGDAVVEFFVGNGSDYGATMEDNVNISAINQCLYRVKSSNKNFPAESNVSNSDLACSAWEYDSSYFRATIVTQWDLVCDKAIVVRTLVSVLNIAVLFAAVYSFIEDRWGRRKAFLLNLSVFLIGTCGSLLAPTPVTFAFLKFVGGITSMWDICYVWAMEFVGPSQRTALTTMLSVIYCVATMSLALLAYLCNTWIELGLCTSAPFIILFSYAAFIPESPRWLLLQGRIDEALSVIENMARWQKVKIDLTSLRATILGGGQDTDKKSYSHSETADSTNSCTALLEKELGTNPNEQQTIKTAPAIIIPKTDRHSNESLSSKSLSIVEFLTNQNMRWKSIFMTTIEVIANQLYFAIPYSLENLSANFYVSYVLQAAVEAPATLLNLLLLNRFGRVVPLSVSLFLSGICCLLTLVDGESLGGWEWAPVLFVVVSRFFICTSVAIIEQLSSELFPTVARGTGQGVSSLLSALASISTQYILYSTRVWSGLPMLIFGNSVLVASIMALFVPETMGLSLPDTLRQAEAQGAVGSAAFKRNAPRLLSVFKKWRCCFARLDYRKNAYKLPLTAADIADDPIILRKSKSLLT